MQLTPEQREQIRAAKAAGEVRVTVHSTPRQKAAWESIVQQEEAGKQENIAHLRKIRAAAKQRGFFGDVRRAIVFSQRAADDLADAIGVDTRLLSDFRAGDADLPPAPWSVWSKPLACVSCRRSHVP